MLTDVSEVLSTSIIRVMTQDVVEGKRLLNYRKKCQLKLGKVKNRHFVMKRQHHKYFLPLVGKVTSLSLWILRQTEEFPKFQTKIHY